MFLRQAINQGLCQTGFRRKVESIEAQRSKESFKVRQTFFWTLEPSDALGTTLLKFIEIEASQVRLVLRA